METFWFQFEFIWERVSQTLLLWLQIWMSEDNHWAVMHFPLFHLWMTFCIPLYFAKFVLEKPARGIVIVSVNLMFLFWVVLQGTKLWCTICPVEMYQLCVDKANKKGHNKRVITTKADLWDIDRQNFRMHYTETKRILMTYCWARKQKLQTPC